MEDIKSMQNVTIVNGKVQDSEYPYDFHIIRDQKKHSMKIYLMIPGIRHNTVDLRIDDLELNFRVSIQKPYYQLYKAKRLFLTGRLPIKVVPKVFTIDYHDGIIEIDLVEKSENKN